MFLNNLNSIIYNLLFEEYQVHEKFKTAPPIFLLMFKFSHLLFLGQNLNPNYLKNCAIWDKAL